jgi:hypothetical protein
MRALVILAILGLIIALVLIFKNHIIHKNIESFRTQNPESQFDTATSYTIIDVLPAYYIAKGVNTFYERVLQSMNPSTPGNSYISFPNNQRTTMYSSATFDGKPNYFKTSTWFSFKRYDTSPDTFALLTQEADRMKQIAEANPILAINIRAELGGNSFYEEDDGYTYWSDSNLDLIRIYMSKAGKRTVYNKIDVIGRITDIAKNEAKQSASVGSILNMSDTSLLDQIMRVKYGDNQPYYSTMMKCKPEFASRVSGSQLIIDPLPNNSRDNDQSCNTPITANLLAIVAFPLRRFLMEVIFSRQTRINQLKGLPAPSKLEPTNYGVNVREKPFLNLLAKSFYSLTNGEKNISYIYDVYSIGSSVVDLRCDIKTHAPGDEINNAYNNLRNTYFNMRFNPFLTEDELDKLTEEYDAKVEALQAAQETNIASTESGALLRVYLEKQGQVFVVTGYSQGLNAVTSFNKWYNGGNEIYDDSTKDAPGLINYTPEIDFDLNKPLLPDFTNEFQLKTFMAEYLDAIEGGISTEVQRVAGADITSKKVAVTEILGSAEINSLQGMIYWKEDHYDQETMKKVASGVIRVGRFVFMKNVDNWYSNELLLDTSGFVFAESTAGPNFSFVGRYQTPENVGRFITLDGNTKYWQTWGSNEVNPVSACSLCPTGTAYCNSAVNITPGEFSLLTVSSTPFNCDILKGNVSVTPKMLDKPISIIATLPPKETLEDSEGMCPTVRCSDPKLLYNIVDTFNNDPEQAGAILKVIKSVEASPNQCDLQVEIDYSVTKKKDDGSPGATAPAGKSGIMRETRAATLELDIRDCSFNVVEIGEADSGTTVFPNTPELFPIFTFATYSKKEFGDRFASILNPVTNMVTTTFNTVKNLIKDYRLGTVALAADLTTLEGCPEKTCRDPALYNEVMASYTLSNWKNARMNKILRVGTVNGTTCDFTFEKYQVQYDKVKQETSLVNPTTEAFRVTLRKDGSSCNFSIANMTSISPSPPYESLTDLSGAMPFTGANAINKINVDYVNPRPVPQIKCSSYKVAKLLADQSGFQKVFTSSTAEETLGREYDGREFVYIDNGEKITLPTAKAVATRDASNRLVINNDLTTVEKIGNYDSDICYVEGIETSQGVTNKTLRLYAINYDINTGAITIDSGRFNQKIENVSYSKNNYDFIYGTNVNFQDGIRRMGFQGNLTYTLQGGYDSGLQRWRYFSIPFGRWFDTSVKNIKLITLNYQKNTPLGMISTCPAPSYTVAALAPFFIFPIYDVKKLRDGVCEVRITTSDTLPINQTFRRVTLFQELDCSLNLDKISDIDPTDTLSIYNVNLANPDVIKALKTYWSALNKTEKIIEVVQAAKESADTYYFKVKRIVYDKNGYITEAYTGAAPYKDLSIIKTSFRLKFADGSILAIPELIQAAPTTVIFTDIADAQKGVVDPPTAIKDHKKIKVTFTALDGGNTVSFTSFRFFNGIQSYRTETVFAYLKSSIAPYSRKINSPVIDNRIFYTGYDYDKWDIQKIQSNDLCVDVARKIDPSNYYGKTKDMYEMVVKNVPPNDYEVKTGLKGEKLAVACYNAKCKDGFTNDLSGNFMCNPIVDIVNQKISRDPLIMDSPYENPEIVTIVVSTQELYFDSSINMNDITGFSFMSSSNLNQMPASVKIMVSDNGAFWKEIYNKKLEGELYTPKIWYSYPITYFTDSTAPVPQRQGPYRLMSLGDCRIDPLDYSTLTKMIGLTTESVVGTGPLSGAKLYITNILRYFASLERGFIVYEVSYYAINKVRGAQGTTDQLFEGDYKTFIVLYADGVSKCEQVDYKVKKYEDLYYIQTEFGIPVSQILFTQFTEFKNKPSEAAVPSSWGGFKDVRNKFINIGNYNIVQPGSITSYDSYGGDERLGASKSYSDLTSFGYGMVANGLAPIYKKADIDLTKGSSVLVPSTQQGFSFMLQREKYGFFNRFSLVLNAARGQGATTIRIGKFALYLWNKQVPVSITSIVATKVDNNSVLTISDINTLLEPTKYSSITIPATNVKLEITLDKPYLFDSYVLVTAIEGAPTETDPVSWTLSGFYQDGKESEIDRKQAYAMPMGRFTATPLLFLDKSQPFTTTNDFIVKTLLDCGLSLENPGALLRLLQASWFTQTRSTFNDLTNPLNITGYNYTEANNTAILQFDSSTDQSTPRKYISANISRVFNCNNVASTPITFQTVGAPPAALTAIPPSADAIQAGHTYLRFRPLALRGGGTAARVGKVIFLKDQRFLPLKSAPTLVKSPAGTDSASILNAVDYSNSATEWSDSTLGVMYVKFSTPTLVDAFAFMTGSAAATDPVRWYVEGSTDGKIWYRLHDQSTADFSTPSERKAVVGPFLLDLSANNFTIPNPFTNQTLGSCGVDPMSQYITNLVMVKARADGLTFEPTRAVYSIAENKATYIQETLGMDYIVQFATTNCSHTITSAVSKQSSDLFCASTDFKTVFEAKTGSQILDIKQAGSACDVRVSDNEELPFGQIYKRAFMIKNPTTGKLDINRIDDGNPAISRFALRPNPTDQKLADTFRAYWNAQSSTDQVYTIYQSGVDLSTQKVYYNLSRALYDGDGFPIQIFSTDFNSSTLIQVEFSMRISNNEIYVKDATIVKSAPIELAPFTDINGVSIMDPRKYMPRFRKIRITIGEALGGSNEMNYELGALQFWSGSNPITFDSSVYLNFEKREFIYKVTQQFYVDTKEYDYNLRRYKQYTIQADSLIYVYFLNPNDGGASIFVPLMGEARGLYQSSIIPPNSITRISPTDTTYSNILVDPSSVSELNTRKNLFGLNKSLNMLMIESNKDLPSMDAFVILGTGTVKWMPTKIRIETSGNGKFWRTVYSNITEVNGFMDPLAFYTGWNVSPLVPFDRKLPFKSVPQNPNKPKYLVDCGYKGDDYEILKKIEESMPYIKDIKRFTYVVSSNAFFYEVEVNTVREAYQGDTLSTYTGFISVSSPVVTDCKNAVLNVNNASLDQDILSTMRPFGDTIRNMPDNGVLPEFWKRTIPNLVGEYTNLGNLSFGENVWGYPSNAIQVIEKSTWRSAIECKKDSKCIGFVYRWGGDVGKSYTFRYDPMMPQITPNTNGGTPFRFYLKKGLSNFKFLRITFLKNRVASDGGFQLAKIGVYNQETLLRPFITSVKNEASGKLPTIDPSKTTKTKEELDTLLTVQPTSSITETPTNLMNYDTLGGWRVTNTPAVRVVIAFERGVIADGYTLVTSTQRNTDLDPVQWKLESSLDGTNWLLADEVTTDFQVPTSRYTSIGLKYFDATRSSVPVTDFQQKSLAACGINCLNPSVVSDFVTKYQEFIKKTPNGFANPTNITQTAYSEDENTCYFKVDDSTAVGVPSASIGLSYSKPPSCSKTLPPSTLSSGVPESITLAPIKNLSSRFLYIRFRPIALRGGAQAIGPMINKMALYNGTEQLSFTGPAVQISTPTGTDTNTATNVFDYFSKNTNWSDTSMMGLYMKVGAAPIEITGFTFLTGTSSPERDPVRWVLEGSSDGTVWQLLHDQSASDYAVPTDRAKQLPLFTFDPSQPAPTVPSIYEKRISSCGSSCADPTILEMVSKATAASGTFFSPDSYAYDAGANSCLYRQANDGSKLLVTFSTNLLCQTTINTITATNTQQGTPTAIPAGTLKGLDDCNQPCDSPDILNSMNTYFTNTLNKPTISAKGGGTDKVNNECLLTLDDNFGEAALQNKPVGVQFRKKTGCTPLEFVRLDTTPTQSLITPTSGITAFKFMRFRPLATRSATSSYVHVSKVKFFIDDATEFVMDSTNTVVTNPQGDGTPANALGTDTTKKWIDTQKKSLVFAFKEAQTLRGFSWSTAPGTSALDTTAAGGDPVRWKLEGSINGVFWQTLHDQSASDYAVNTGRLFNLPIFHFDGSAPAARAQPVIITAPVTYGLKACNILCSHPNVISVMTAYYKINRPGIPVGQVVSAISFTRREDVEGMPTWSYDEANNQCNYCFDETMKITSTNKTSVTNNVTYGFKFKPQTTCSNTTTNLQITGMVYNAQSKDISMWNQGRPIEKSMYDTTF